MLRSAAESARSKMTVAEFGPGSPPNDRRADELKAESVCQANIGPDAVVELDELLDSCHGGDEASNGVDKGRYRISLEVGAEVYEYELDGSVLPPWINSALFTSATAWPHLFAKLEGIMEGNGTATYRGIAVYCATTPKVGAKMQSMHNK
jgi:hypothetical protein